jgi:hypothetical protein
MISSRLLSAGQSPRPRNSRVNSRATTPSQLSVSTAVMKDVRFSASQLAVSTAVMKDAHFPPPNHPSEASH